MYHELRKVGTSVPLVLTFVNEPAAIAYECQNRHTRELGLLRWTAYGLLIAIKAMGGHKIAEQGGSNDCKGHGSFAGGGSSRRSIRGWDGCQGGRPHLLERQRRCS